MTSKLFTTLAAATTLAGIVTTAGAANAASLSYSASIARQKTDIINAPLSVQQFNSSLGTLNSIDLEFTSSIIGNGTATNTADSSSRFTLLLDGEVRLVDGVSNSRLLELFPSTSTYRTTLLGKESISIPTQEATDTINQTLTTGSLFQSFIGNGNRTFFFTAEALSTVGGSGNVRSNISTEAEGFLRVTYNYTEAPKSVPEPSAVLGIGLAGVGIFLQTRKNRLKTSNS